MFPKKFKPYKGRLFNASFGAMLSMLLTFVGFMPQPVAADPQKITLSIERQGHTATVLVNGKVLIAGGQDQAGSALKKSEIDRKSVV